jgi:hypothetical protein
MACPALTDYKNAQHCIGGTTINSVTGSPAYSKCWLHPRILLDRGFQVECDDTVFLTTTIHGFSPTPGLSLQLAVLRHGSEVETWSIKLTHDDLHPLYDKRGGTGMRFDRGPPPPSPRTPQQGGGSTTPAKRRPPKTPYRPSAKRFGTKKVNRPHIPMVVSTLPTQLSSAIERAHLLQHTTDHFWTWPEGQLALETHLRTFSTANTTSLQIHPGDIWHSLDPQDSELGAQTCPLDDFLTDSLVWINPSSLDNYRQSLHSAILASNASTQPMRTVLATLSPQSSPPRPATPITGQTRKYVTCWPPSQLTVTA